MRVTLAFVGICMMALSLSCPSETVRAPQPPSTPQSDDIVLFITGNELGALKPCGCSGGQLGGIEKRTGIFATEPRAGRLVIDTGALIRDDREQDIIKFRILFEAFGLLGYDLVHLTTQDVEIARQLNVLNEGQRPFTTIGATGQGADLLHVFTKRFTVRGRTIAVNVAAFDVQIGQAGPTAGLFPDGGDSEIVNVLILNAGQEHLVQETLAGLPPSIDCVIWPSDSDEPRILGDAGARPLVLTVGRFGRYVCRLGVTAPEANGPVSFRFAAIPVEERLPNDETLVQLYRSYQQIVTDSRLLEQYPRIPLPEDLAFVGSRTCKRCHEYEYEQWSAKAHADAFATLKKVGSDHDPECVICHVVGMEYASGFVTEEQTAHLKDVGCENCHGPGSAHVLALGHEPTTEPQMRCRTCHTPEHSSSYTGSEEEFMKKIVHWREP